MTFVDSTLTVDASKIIYEVGGGGVGVCLGGRCVCDDGGVSRGAMVVKESRKMPRGCCRRHIGPCLGGQGGDVVFYAFACPS